ncbi:MAG: hypothetical protein EHM20_06300, partial [Alphaproteobacteria bacterium]
QGLIVTHPHTGELIASAPSLSGVMPKETELISIIMNEVQQRRNVLVYIQNSNTTDISPRLVELLQKESLHVKVLKSGDTEGRAHIIQNWIDNGVNVLITNPKKVEVGMDLLDFPTIIFYQIPLSTYTLRQASRRSWRIPQKKPVRVYFLTYARTMQTRLMQLMADKLTCSLALEGELTDKGLSALSESSDSMARELAKMFIDKSEGNRTLKDIWSAYRKKEVQAEITMRHDIEASDIESETLSREEIHEPIPEVRKVSSEVEKIGDRVVKIQFVEYISPRKKKVTHIEVKEADLDEMISQKGIPSVVQYSLF